jgi:hypothetical protein
VLAIAVFLAVVVAGASFPRWSRSERGTVRRAVLRVVGESAALALRVYDPWARQSGATPGGLPSRAFLATPVSDSGSRAWSNGAGDRGIVRVLAVHSASEPHVPEFQFERWNNEILADLRRTYSFERLFHSSRPDYPSLLAMSEWVASRLQPGANDPTLATHFDARQVLDRASRGERFTCGTFAWTLIQILGSIGINARLVELEAADGASHSIVEAWCDDLGKWLVLDPFTNLTVELHGVPLDALEVHDLWQNGGWREITLRPANGGPRIADMEKLEDFLRLYEHFDVRMRNNVGSTSYPRWHPKANRVMSAFEWNGDGEGRWFYRISVRDSARLYFPLKSTALRWSWASPDPSGRPELDVRLATCSANFESFLYSKDGRHWRMIPNHIAIRPPSGRDTLRFAARNRGGRVGAEAWMIVESSPTEVPSTASSAGGR